MKLTVITVVFNTAGTIGDALDAVDRQTYPDLEHLVIDGGSTDGTLELLKAKEEAWRTWVSEPDEGLYDAMNKGLRKASGDLIGILNADDLFEDERVLEDLVKKLEEENADAVYGDLVYVDAKDPDKVRRHWVAGPYREGRFLKGWMPPHPTFYAKRHLFQSFGGYRTELSSSADYELMLRFIHKYGVKPAYLDRSVVRMRMGGQSNVSLKNRIRANKEDRKAWRMNGLKPPFYTLWMKPLSKLFQFWKR